jgi:hypothetical protein
MSAACLRCGSDIDADLGIATGLLDHVRLFHPDDYEEPADAGGEFPCPACGVPFTPYDGYAVRFLDMPDGEHVMTQNVCLTCGPET